MIIKQNPKERWNFLGEPLETFEQTLESPAQTIVYELLCWLYEDIEFHPADLRKHKYIGRLQCISQNIVQVVL